MGTFVDTATSLSTLMVDTTFNTATTSLATECITNAEDEIRRALAPRYDISSDYFQTSTATPPAVTKICKWLSIGYMYEALSRGGKDAFGRADRYIKKATEELKSIQEYKSHLYDSSGSLIAEGANSLAMTSTTKDYHDTFAEDDELDWKVDSDKIDDIADERT